MCFRFVNSTLKNLSYDDDKKAEILKCLIISRKLLGQTPFFRLNYTTKFKPNFFKQILASYRQSILLDSVKTSGVFIFVTYFIAEVYLRIHFYKFLVSCIFSQYIIFLSRNIYFYISIFLYLILQVSCFLTIFVYFL